MLEFFFPKKKECFSFLGLVAWIYRLIFAFFVFLKDLGLLIMTDAKLQTYAKQKMDVA